MKNMDETMEERLALLLKEFKLPTVSEQLSKRLIQDGQQEALSVLVEVFEMERQERWERRVQRLRKQSKLPVGKTFDMFEMARLPLGLQQKLKRLSSGHFLEKATNVLAFGLPGTGKTHAACALGHALVEKGHSVLFSPTFRVVQHLIKAKRELSLARELKKLDRFDLVILDDIGYVQQDADEVEVLFTLMAERYERRSLMLTSNLVFSQWEQIFKNPMTTAAAIDRLVHHSEILEFAVSSYRTLHKQESREKGEEQSTRQLPNDEAQQQAKDKD